MGWEKTWESEADRILRQLAMAAKVLGRLPTEEDVHKGLVTEMPTQAKIVIATGKTVENVLKELASLLYKRGLRQSKPVELTPEELAEPEDERVEIEREYQEFYERRLAQILELGGVRRIRDEQSDQIWRDKHRVDESKIVRLPTLSSRELREQREQARAKGEMHWTEKVAILPSESLGQSQQRAQLSRKKDQKERAMKARAERLRMIAEIQQRKPETEVKTEKTENVSPKTKTVEMTSPRLTAERKMTEMAEKPENYERVDKTMAGRVSKEQALMGLAKVYQATGKVSSQAVINYTHNNRGSGVPAVATLRKLLGDPSTWEPQLTEYVQQKNAEAKAQMTTQITEAAARETDGLTAEAFSTVLATSEKSETEETPAEIKTAAIEKISGVAAKGTDDITVEILKEVYRTPETPETSGTPETPKISEVSETSEVPDVFETSEEPKADAPEESKTNNVPKSEPVETAETKVSEETGAEASEEPETDKTAKRLISLNISSVTVEFQLNGQDYEFRLGFGK